MRKQQDVAEKDLLPCPFCGSKAEYGYHEAYSCDSSFEYVGCTNCSAMIMDGTGSEWNERVKK